MLLGPRPWPAAPGLSSSQLITNTVCSRHCCCPNSSCFLWEQPWNCFCSLSGPTSLFSQCQRKLLVPSVARMNHCWDCSPLVGPCTQRSKRSPWSSPGPATPSGWGLSQLGTLPFAALGDPGQPQSLGRSPHCSRLCPWPAGEMPKHPQGAFPCPQGNFSQVPCTDSVCLCAHRSACAGEWAECCS
uniref:Uncharacterized protein n=1 Tax=Serinus canaria TaxID=9135 RepID=A0A8C9L3T3_SERCA